MPPMGGIGNVMRGGPTNGAHTRKVQKPKNIKGAVLRLLSYMKHTKIALIAALGCVVISTVTSIIASYMLRPIINAYISYGNSNIAGLINSLILMAAVYISGVVATYIQARLMLHVSQSALSQIRKELFEKMQQLPISFFDKNSKGDLMSRYTNDVDVVGEMLNNTVVQLFSGAMTIIGTLIMMVYTNVWLAIITFVMAPIIIKSGRAVATKGRKVYAAQQKAIGELNGYIEETISGQKVVKVFNHEDRAIEEFRQYNDELRRKQIKAQFFGGIMGPVVGNLGQINYSLTAAIGGVFCVLRGFDVGGLTIFVTYARQFSRPVNEITMQMNTIFSALAGAERVFEIMDVDAEASYGEIENYGTHESEDISGRVERLDKVRGDIIMEHVDFGYNKDKLVLKDISIHAKRGEKIAFVGSTGAGKTTITNLINRFYEIQRGRITLDGIDIRNIPVEELRSNIALVLQDTHLFTGTVRENIRYGRLDATDEEVIAAAKTANADYFIRRLSHGYDTVLEGDDANLSQGQRQLLNIARAALSKAPVLILDEATSSVDTITEHQIQDAMKRLMSDRTTLVIAHRLSTIRDADAIMVLEHGSIIQRGSHEQLLDMGGRYYELYTGKAELD